MELKVTLFVCTLFLITGYTQIVTVPISAVGAVASTTFHVVGAAGGAIVNTATGGSSKD